MIEAQYVDNFEEFYDEMSEHFKDHYENCEEYRAGFSQLNVNKELFQKAIDSGAANMFLLKVEDKPVGYVNVSISPSLLFQEPQAVIDLLYILPDERKKGYTAEAIKEIEQELKGSGLNALNIMLPDKEYSAAVADGLGYVKTTAIYTKQLGE